MIASTQTTSSESQVSLTEHGYECLRTDILTGNLRPGEKLKISALSKRYEMGATPIREALSRLSSESLVAKMEHKGFKVADVSREEFDEIFETRKLIESETLRQSVTEGDRAWEDRLVASFFRLDRTDQNDPSWEPCHRDFHCLLLSACPSNRLKSYCRDLYDQSVRYRNVARMNSIAHRDVREEHRLIFEASVAHDADSAVKHLISHYAATHEMIDWPHA